MPRTALWLVLALGCSRQPDGATRGTETMAPPAVHCLSQAELERDIGTGFKLSHELSVVRVAPDDVLRLRKSPGSHEELVGKLLPDARGVRAQGSACRVDDALWLKVTHGSQRGWVEESFLLPTTAPVERTARFAKLLESERFEHAKELVATIQASLERDHADQSEPPFRAELIGMSDKERATTALLYSCCYADDSVSGEQIWLDLVQDGDGRWWLRRARASLLCSRGTSGALCN